MKMERKKTETNTRKDHGTKSLFGIFSFGLYWLLSHFWWLENALRREKLKDKEDKQESKILPIQ